MRQLLRLAAFLAVSIFLASALGATAWAVPAKRRDGYRAKFLKTWSCAVCSILGIRVDVVGETPPAGCRLTASNHLGYTDIPVLGSVLPGTFVSKAEVARWPLIGILAGIAGTVFVDRENRTASGEFVLEMKRRIENGGNVLVFAEGTSSRGDGILPFKSVPFAAVAGDHGKSVLPVHIDVVEIDGWPALGARRDAICWHGDAAFAPHFFRLLAFRGIRYRIVIGVPIPGGGLDRKSLALATRERIVSLGNVSSRLGIQPDWGIQWFHPIP